MRLSNSSSRNESGGLSEVKVVVCIVFLLFFLYLITLPIGCCEAEAEERKFVPRLDVHILSSANLETADAGLRDAIRQMRKELRRPVRLMSVVQEDDDGPALTLKNWTNRSLNDYWLQKHVGKRRIQLIIAGPLDGIYYGGMASSRCAPITGRAVVYADDESIEKTSFIIRHEIGHLLGAFHDEELPYSTMHPAPWQYIWVGFLNFSKKSKRDIRYCLDW